MIQQSKIDSFLEAFTNIAIGFVIAMISNFLIIPPVMGVSPTMGESFVMTCGFTVISFLRQYILRRVFNGRTVYEGIKSWFAGNKNS